MDRHPKIGPMVTFLFGVVELTKLPAKIAKGLHRSSSLRKPNESAFTQSDRVVAPGFHIYR